MRHTLVAAFITVCGAAVMSGQHSPATEFEVASVKRPAPDPPRFKGLNVPVPPPGHWHYLTTLTQLITVAYPAFGQDGLIVGGPSWIRQDKFEVDARTDPTTTAAQMAPMMAHLLADRFTLRSHTERRPVPVYVLRLARADGQLGPKLTRTAEPCVQARTTRQPLPTECRNQGVVVNRIDEYLRYLSLLGLDRPVIDRTGLTGYFDIRLTYSCGPFASAASCSSADGVSFFTALQEQAGLKLEPAREAVDVLVIDSAKMPEPD